MSNELHPNYLIALESPFNGLQGETRIAQYNGYNYYISLYPSGLVLRIWASSHSHTLQYRPSSNSVIGPVDVHEMMWLSPSPKAYEFLDNNGQILWKINNSDWVNPTSDCPFYTCRCAYTQYGSDTYYVGRQSSYNYAVNQLLFIDSQLWNFNENKTVSGNQTEEDVALYPIYKIEGESRYYLNGTNLSGTYNFLTSYSALYQYDSENKLKDGYFMTSNEQAKDENKKTRSNVLSNNNRLVICNGQIRNRFGSINDTGIDYDNAYREYDYHFKDNNEALIQNSTNDAQILFSNFPEHTNNIISYNASTTNAAGVAFLVDEYHSYINKNLIRHPRNYKFMRVTRRCTSSMVSAFNQADHSLPEYFTGFNKEALGPNVAQGKIGSSYEFKWYEGNYQISVSAGSVFLRLLPGHVNTSASTGGINNEEPRPADFNFKLNSSNYNLNREELKATGWSSSSDILPIINKHVIATFSLQASINFSAWNGPADITIQLNNNIHDGDVAGTGTNYRFIFDITYPTLQYFKTYSLNNFEKTKRIQYERKGKEKWLRPEDAYWDPDGFFSVWGYNDGSNTSRAGFTFTPHWTCDQRGLIPSGQTPMKLITNEYLVWQPMDGWIGTTMYEDSPTYQSVTYDIGESITVFGHQNYIGFSSSFYTTNANAVCIFGKYTN